MVLFSSINTIWVLVGAALIFFMQAGFCAVEAGLTRAKNAGNIIMKNLMDFVLGTLVYFFIGFGIMFGEDLGGFIGKPHFFAKDLAGAEGSVAPMVNLIFQTVFCATSATIVSGAMAERTKFSSYLMYTICISLFIYPVTGHWVWGGGWLQELGFIDLAGSTAVHMVGGICALVGAKILGPRIGKYDENGNPVAIPGHNLTIAALGVFILWFCWFGFNGASLTSIDGDDLALSQVGNIFVTTNIAAAAGALIVMIISWIKFKKPDVSMTLNGALAGLVAVTAGCQVVTPIGSLFIGLIAGLVVFFGVIFVEKVLKVDDPVGAVGVHCFCGAVGTILTGLFACYNTKGLFYDWSLSGLKVFGIQCLGVLTVAAYTADVITIGVLLIKKFHGLRVSEEEETVGLDIMEHGLASSYADFMPLTTSTEKQVLNVSQAIPTTTIHYHDESTAELKKVVIVTKRDRFEALQNAMNALGVTGMTVTNVMGYGVQKGNAAEYYRGALVKVNLLPQVKVEIVVSKIPVDIIVETAKKAIYTGKAGDGKIFVYDVDQVVRIRTGEEGFDALQDDKDVIPENKEPETVAPTTKEEE